MTWSRSSSQVIITEWSKVLQLWQAELTYWKLRFEFSVLRVPGQSAPRPLPPRSFCDRILGFTVLLTGGSLTPMGSGEWQTTHPWGRQLWPRRRRPKSRLLRQAKTKALRRLTQLKLRKKGTKRRTKIPKSVKLSFRPKQSQWKWPSP